MFATLLTVVVVHAANTQAFKITRFHVPSVVSPEQPTVDIECSYDANFTILNWFKGSTEFFRYKPGAAPSTRSFPILGVGTIDLISCGPTECRLRLGDLTDEASGLYRCDLELDKPPYKFETRTGYMKVYRPVRRKPQVEGLAPEFGEDEEIKAYCRAEHDAEIRWYVNGKEMLESRGNRTLKVTSKRSIFQGLTQPIMTVQCAEYIEGKLIGSNEAQSRWNESSKLREHEDTNKSCASGNKSNVIGDYRFSLLVLVALIYLFDNKYK